MPRRQTGPSADLTFRERQIVRYVAQGYSNPEIADNLGLSRNTVKTYLQLAFQKLGARNRVEVVRLAGAAGLLEEPSPPPVPEPPPPYVPMYVGGACPRAMPQLPEVSLASAGVRERLSRDEPPQVRAMREAWAEVEAARVAALERLRNGSPPPVKANGSPPPVEAAVADQPADQPAAPRGEDPWAFAHVEWASPLGPLSEIF